MTLNFKWYNLLPLTLYNSYPFQQTIQFEMRIYFNYNIQNGLFNNKHPKRFHYLTDIFKSDYLLILSTN